MNWQTLACFMLGLVWCSLPVNAATRVALVSTCGGESEKDLLALATAKLSAEPGIELVERAEVERVLQEQKLWRCGLSSYGQAVAAGKLLGVDVFAAVEVLPNEKDALGLVCFAADSGARLMDVVLPKGTAPTVASAILGAVRDACIKQQLPGNNRNTVCILAVRNAGLARGLDGVCESVGRMLERRLLNSPSLAVLERARLDQVNRERDLPVAGGTTNALRAALNLFELEFTHGTGSNDIHVTVFQSNAAGPVLSKMSADAALDRTADLVESISGQMITALQASPLVRKIDRRAEALRFSREAKFFHENSQDIPALQAAEAAVALDPANKNIQQLLFSTMLSRANSLLQKNISQGVPDEIKHGLALAHRAVQLQSDLVETMPPKQQVALTIRSNPFPGFGMIIYQIRDKFDAEAQAEYAEIESICRRTYLKLWQAVFDAQKLEPDLGYGSGYTIYMYLGGIWGETNSTVWASDMLHGLEFWLARVDTVGVCRVHHDRTPWVLLPMLYRLRYPERLQLFEKRRWPTREEDLVRLGGFFEKLKQHPEPLLQIYGRGGDLAKLLRRDPEATATVQSQLAEIIQLGKATVASPTCPSMNYRGAVYQAMLDLLDLFAEHQWRQQQRQELFDFMLANNEIYPQVVRVVVDPGAPDFAAHTEFMVFRSEPRVAGGANAANAYRTNITAYARNLERLIERAESTGFSNSREVQETYGRSSLDQQLLGLCDRLGVKPPSAIKEAAPLWSSAKLLWTGKLDRLVQPRVVNNNFWALDIDRSPASLVRIPLDGGTVEYFDRIPFPDLPDQQYAVVRGNAIDIFPVNEVKVSHFTETNGIPSGPITAAVCCGGNLYAAIGQGPSYLVKSDLKTGVVELLASSLRKEKRNPLDSASPPFCIRHMIADPDRHQVLFTVDIGGNTSHGTDFTGFWSLDTRTDQLTLLLPLEMLCDWVSPIRANEILMVRRCWLYGCYYSLIAYNLETRKGQMLYSTSWKKTDEYLTGGTPPPLLNADTKFPHLMVDGWLWSANPFCRILTNGVPREFLPSFTGKPLTSVKYLELVNAGRQILAGTDNQLWLLTLPENKAKETP